MSDVRIRVGGEVCLTFEAIGECYQCEVSWVREAYEAGLFGGGRLHAGSVVIPAARLDRVAQVLRLSRYEGLGFETIFVLLGELLEDDDFPAGSWR